MKHKKIPIFYQPQSILTEKFHLPSYLWELRTVKITADSQEHFPPEAPFPSPIDYSILNGRVKYTILFLKLGFTPCKAEQPLQGMELQEKEPQKD